MSLSFPLREGCDVQQYWRMDKTDSLQFDTRPHLNKSVGVGDGELFLHRDRMEWSAIFIDGKFFMADPQSVSKLQQIQAQIELERRMAEEGEGEARRGESFHSYTRRVDEAEHSCVTEVDAGREKLCRFRVEEELEREEELYQRRIAEARNRKKEERRGGKNLIKFTPKEREDYKSVKMGQKEGGEGGGEGGGETGELQHSMVNKITPTKQDLRKESERKNKKGNGSEKQGLINADVLKNQINAQKSQKTNKQQGKKQMQINSIVKITIDEPILPASLHKNRQILMESDAIHLKPREQHPINNAHIESPSILSLKTESQHRIAQQMASERAGDRFFYQLHSKIDELQQKIEVIKNESPSPQKVAIMPAPQVAKREQRAPYKHVESSAMVNTKNMLRDLNKQLREIGMIEPAEDSRITDDKHLNSISGIRVVQGEEQNREKHNEILAELNSAERGQRMNRDLEVKNEVQIKIEPSPSKPIKNQEKSETNQMKQAKAKQTKRENCKLISSLVNQHILQGAPRPQVQRSKEQRQKLNEEISILKQVINELRVERIKYQTSNNDNPDEAGTVYSHFQRTQKEHNEGQHMSHRVTASVFNNFAESVVSQFQTNQHKSLTHNNNKSGSGKIIKNFSPSRKMPKIEEELKSEMKQREIKEQFNESQRRQTQNCPSLGKSQQKERELMNMKEAESVKVKTGSEQVSNRQEQSQFSKNIELVQVNNSQSAWGSHVKSKLLFNKSIAPTINNHSVKVQPDIESSMPRPLNRHNHSQPPKLTANQHQAHQKRHETSLKKKAVDNFDSLQQEKSNNKAVSLNRSAADPKKRASKQGIFKTVQAKASYHPDLNKIVFGNADSGLKNKMMEIEQKQREGVGERRNSFHQSKSSKGFRLRKGSDSSRHSRVSSTKKSEKQYERGRLMEKEERSKVYVPAFHQQNYVQPASNAKNQSVPIQKMVENESKVIKNERSSVSKRKITFSTIQIPKIPQVPSAAIKIQQMGELIKKICVILSLEVRESELHRLIMKKYKNCVMLDIPNSQTSKLVWHYNGKLYVGEWNEAEMVKSGEGIEYIPDKYYYKGQFLGGRRSGSGIMIQWAGVIYEGQWLEGEKNGRGKYFDSANGISYEGEWKNGKKEGFGYFCIEQQSVYQGTFVQNLKDGFGAQSFFNQDSYKGQYCKGRFHGRGRYVWASGDVYQGEFFEGCKHGRGVWTSFIGEVYEGGYKLDKKNGSGKYRWGNGCVFQGEFEADKKNGNGVLKYPNGREVRGIWREGKMVQTFDEGRRDDLEQPLSPIKSRMVETTTHIKVQNKPYGSHAVQQRRN